MATTKSPLIFTILAECHTSKARTSRMILQHGVVDTPVFMPVGTQVNERKKNHLSLATNYYYRELLKECCQNNLKNLDCKLCWPTHIT
jgi:hypothetical protein